jgi:aldose sugar dehydrogenase
MAFHPKTGQLWINDHGPKGGDEINRVLPGRNYGWPFQTAGVDYSGAPLGKGAKVKGMEPPVHVFKKTAAPSGLTFYTIDLFPAWRGDMLHGALRGAPSGRLGRVGQRPAQRTPKSSSRMMMPAGTPRSHSIKPLNIANLRSE